MYSRFAEKKGWKFEVVDTSFSPIGGLKEAIAEIRGQGAYSVLKYESGVHRVQRVPKTEASGRIHTSTATVAVLPEAEEIDLKLDPKDLKIEAFGSSGPGRPERQPELHGDPRHPQALGPRRLLPGREIPAPQQGEGPAGPALAAHGHRPAASSRQDRRPPPLPGRDGGAEREDPDLQLPPIPDHRPPAERELPQHGGRPGRGPRRDAGPAVFARPRPSEARPKEPARSRTLEPKTLIELFRAGSPSWPASPGPRSQGPPAPGGPDLRRAISRRPRQALSAEGRGPLPAPRRTEARACRSPISPGRRSSGRSRSK